METLKGTLDATGTWIAVGLLVGIGWQLSKSTTRWCYDVCSHVFDKCVEKLDK